MIDIHASASTAPLAMDFAKASCADDAWSAPSTQQKCDLFHKAGLNLNKLTNASLLSTYLERGPNIKQNSDGFETYNYRKD